MKDIVDFVLKKRSFAFHFWVTFFTGGLWLFIYIAAQIYSEFNPSQQTSASYDSDPCNEFEHTNYFKYDSVFKLHFENIEKINMLYTIANNISTPNSTKMQQVIDLCLEDIKLAPQIKEYYLSEDKNASLPTYPSFQRLAIIYEKQKEYQKAIDVCEYAIKLGFYRDGTAGQLPGRIARLIKKANKENIAIDEHSTIL